MAFSPAKKSFRHNFSTSPIYSTLASLGNNATMAVPNLGTTLGELNDLAPMLGRTSSMTFTDDGMEVDGEKSQTPSQDLHDLCEMVAECTTANGNFKQGKSAEDIEEQLKAALAKIESMEVETRCAFTLRRFLTNAVCRDSQKNELALKESVIQLSNLLTKEREFNTSTLTDLRTQCDL